MNDAKQIGENWVYKGDSLIFMVTEPKTQPKASEHAAELAQVIYIWAAF